MHTNPILSFLVRIKIRIEQLVDLAWRNMTGLPIMKYSQVTPHLYLGGQYGLQAIPLFQKRGITAIVNMRTSQIHPANAYPFLKILNLPTKDWTEPTIEDLQKGVAFITQELATGGSVYIHCHYGIGRGPVMAIAYLMSTGLTLEDAISEVKKVRAFISPNGVQLHRLEEFSALIKDQPKAAATS